LVDSELLKKIAKVLHAEMAAEGKDLLARAPINALPDSVVTRSKTGFQTPIENWLRAIEGARSANHMAWARNWSVAIASQVNPLLAA
jgi:hypothetical protein